MARIPEEWVAEQKASLPAATFAREFLCSTEVTLGGGAIFSDVALESATRLRTVPVSDSPPTLSELIGGIE